MIAQPPPVARRGGLPTLEMIEMDHNTMTCGCCGGSLPMQQVWEARRHTAGDCTGGVDENGRCFAFSDSDWELHHKIINGVRSAVKFLRS